MKVSTNTPRVMTPTRLAVAALGTALVSSLAVAATPASASRPDPYGTVVTTAAHHRVVLDPGEMLAQRKSMIDARWWVRLGNAG
jgi:hypothetical protein